MKTDQYCQRKRCKHVEYGAIFGMLKRRAGLSALSVRVPGCQNVPIWQQWALKG